MRNRYTYNPLTAAFADEFIKEAGPFTWMLGKTEKFLGGVAQRASKWQKGVREELEGLKRLEKKKQGKGRIIPESAPKTEAGKPKVPKEPEVSAPAEPKAPEAPTSGKPKNKDGWGWKEWGAAAGAGAGLVGAGYLWGRRSSRQYNGYRQYNPTFRG